MRRTRYRRAQRRPRSGRDTAVALGAALLVYLAVIARAWLGAPEGTGNVETARADPVPSTSGSESSAWQQPDDDGKRATLSNETMDAGLNLAVKDNDSRFPPEWRLSRSGRDKPADG